MWDTLSRDKPQGEGVNDRRQDSLGDPDEQWSAGVPEEGTACRTEHGALGTDLDPLTPIIATLRTATVPPIPTTRTASTPTPRMLGKMLTPYHHHHHQ